jgi:hypothetical protein
VARDAGETGARRARKAIENRFDVHEPGIDDEAAADAQVCVQQGSSKAVVERQHGHHAITRRQVQ